MSFAEHIIQSIREGRKTDSAYSVDEQITVMTEDPEIQTELKIIENEFMAAETDGLEKF